MTSTINRTYCYFEPEEVRVGCFFDGQDDVGIGKWDCRIDKSKTFKEVDNLHECRDGDIVVQFSIEKLYGDLKRWTLKGTAKYRLKEPLIEINKQYANPEIGIHLEYVLPEEQIMKLKEEVEKAIGDER
jgi:hypothetical protein